jgi:uncharacterized membrane protein YjjB (DUF3815 family)
MPTPLVPNTAHAHTCMGTRVARYYYACDKLANTPAFFPQVYKLCINIISAMLHVSDNLNKKNETFFSTVVVFI